MATIDLALGSDLIMDFSFSEGNQIIQNIGHKTTPGFSRIREKAVLDISENWVEEYGKFKTWEEKESGFF